MTLHDEDMLWHRKLLAVFEFMWYRECQECSTDSFLPKLSYYFSMCNWLVFITQTWDLHD